MPPSCFRLDVVQKKGIKMMKSGSIAAALWAASALAQSQYGENHVTVNRDSQLLEQAAFPAPNVTLYSPAFMANASFDAGWYQGTEGATSASALGMEPPPPPLLESRRCPTLRERETHLTLTQNAS